MVLDSVLAFLLGDMFEDDFGGEISEDEICLIIYGFKTDLTKHPIDFDLLMQTLDMTLARCKSPVNKDLSPGLRHSVDSGIELDVDQDICDISESLETDSGIRTPSESASSKSAAILCKSSATCDSAIAHSGNSRKSQDKVSLEKLDSGIGLDSDPGFYDWDESEHNSVIEDGNSHWDDPHASPCSAGPGKK